jgi:septal ring factor EnvC (AmiA/AmiB activator)
MIFFTKKQPKSAPLLIIKKETDEPNVKEYNSIEEAIADLEKDPNVSADKIDKLRSTLKKLKNNTSIKIKDGKILK